MTEFVIILYNKRERGRKSPQFLAKPVEEQKQKVLTSHLNELTSKGKKTKKRKRIHYQADEQISKTCLGGA